MTPLTNNKAADMMPMPVTTLIIIAMADYSKPHSPVASSGSIYTSLQVTPGTSSQFVF